MKKIILTTLPFAAMLAILSVTACGDSGSTKACQRIAYCYKTTDNPDQRHCELDSAFAASKVKAAEEAGTLHTPLYEDCWDF